MKDLFNGKELEVLIGRSTAESEILVNGTKLNGCLELNLNINGEIPDFAEVTLKLLIPLSSIKTKSTDS
jgi:hypothetical protein